MVTALKRYNGAPGACTVPFFVMGALVEMPGEVSHIFDITAHDLARTHVLYYNDDAKRNKGMYRQRIQRALGHSAHRGWARFPLDRTRDLVIHGRRTAAPEVRRYRRTRTTITATSFSLPRRGHLAIEPASALSFGE